MSKRHHALVVLGLTGAICGIVFGMEGLSKVTAARTAAQTAMKKAKGTTDPSGVMYFPQSENVAAFEESLVLDDQVPKKNYRVAIYHRDKGGEVEVHKKDTDVFYIVEGSATFVTGGTTTGGREIEPDEMRGGTMQGGVERRVSKGDVIVVPANVTHWYKEVQQPITYFGVKVQ